MKSGGGGEPEAARTGPWVPYEPAAASPEADWLVGLLGLRSFRMLLGVALASVAVLLLRSVLVRGRLPAADVVTFAALALILWLVSRRPDWFKPLSWAVLGVLLLDALDGLAPVAGHPVRPTHALLPMLVLYGALLCDPAITAVACAAVLGACAHAWAVNAPLRAEDATMLFNVVLATVISGATALGVWMHHRRLVRELRERAAGLQFELGTSNRLNAVIFHDIANPLAVLVGELDLARLRGGAGVAELGRMGRMAERIGTIIDTVRAINRNGLGQVPRELVTMERVEAELRELFAARLAAKGQTLSLAAGAGLGVRTVPGVLLNSVLGNLLANAIKFSPRGALLEIAAAREGERVRIELRDRGAGFPPELLRRKGARATPSLPGTEGEQGSGCGLDIAALHAAKLGGVLEIRNREDGGAAASVVLPRPEAEPARP